MRALKVEIAEPRRAAALAISDLLARIRVTHAFVGEIAVRAWLGGVVDSGAVDVLAQVGPEGHRQVPMMASNRGFLVDEAELESARELDVIPLRYGHEGASTRVHVLLASNTLYSRMLGRAVECSIGDGKLTVVHAEDLALMLLLSDDRPAAERLSELVREAGDGFDVARFNSTLKSIGLGGKALPA
jgi:hypothetical protein